MDIIFSYIEKYYINFALPSLIVTEILFISGAIVIFTNYSKEHGFFYYFFRFILEYFAMLIPLVILKAFFNYYALVINYTFLIVLTTYALIKSRKNIINGLIYLFWYATFYIFLTNLGKSIIGIIFINILNTEYSFIDLQISLSITSAIVLSGATLIIKFFPINKFRKVNPYSVLLFGIVFLISEIAKVLVDSIKGENMPFYGLAEENSSLFIFLCAFLIYLINFGIYLLSLYISYKSFKDSSLSKKVQLIAQNEREVANIEDSMNLKLEEMRSLRHDISNQISYMQLMMYNKNYDELNEYFNKYTENIFSTISFPDCLNKTISNVLNLEFLKAKQEKIKIDAKVVVPEIIGVEDFDLINLLTNLIDNAIEGMVHDEIKDSTIKINIQVNGEYLYIQVTNPIKESNLLSKRKALLTTKKDKEFHGRGTKIIKSIVKKYDGSVDFNVNEEFFDVSLMLRLKEVKNDE